MGGANGSRECAPDDKLRDTHQLHFMEMMGFAGSTYLRAPLVPRMLRSAISAFTRVFDAMTCGVVRC